MGPVRLAWAPVLVVVGLASGCKLVANIEDTTLIPNPDASTGAIDVGDGRDGTLVVSGTSRTDETRAKVTGAASATFVPVASIAGFEAGDEVLIIQMTGDRAGYHETHRIFETGPNRLTLATPLGVELDGDSNAVQAIRVENYSSVMVPEGSVLTGASGAITSVIPKRSSSTSENQGSHTPSPPGLLQRPFTQSIATAQA